MGTVSVPDDQVKRVLVIVAHPDDADCAAIEGPQPRKAGPAFVEWASAALAPPPSAQTAEYVVELDARQGRVLRVRARGAAVADVAELARRLAEAAP